MRGFRVQGQVKVGFFRILDFRGSTLKYIMGIGAKN